MYAALYKLQESLKSAPEEANTSKLPVLSSSEMLERIEEHALKVFKSLAAGVAPEYTFTARTDASNVMYDKVRQRNRMITAPKKSVINLKNKNTRKSFGAKAKIRFLFFGFWAAMTRILNSVHELQRSNLHATKRDLYYTHTTLFKKQAEADNVVENVACMLGVSRANLNVFGGRKGAVAGRVSFTHHGEQVDGTKCGAEGYSVPADPQTLANLQTDALFVLIIEKDTTFVSLINDGFYNKHPCILVTGKGQPDVATRLFLKQLEKLNIPMLALLDADPYGIEILSTYVCGSLSMAYDAENLALPNVKSDFSKYGVPDAVRVALTEQDAKKGNAMLKRGIFEEKAAWRSELEAMLASGVKAEIQSLSHNNLAFLCDTYLPAKIAAGDWV